MRHARVVLFSFFLATVPLEAQSGGQTADPKRTAELKSSVNEWMQQINAAIDSGRLIDVFPLSNQIDKAVLQELSLREATPRQRQAHLEERYTSSPSLAALLSLPRAAFEAGDYSRAHEYAKALLQAAAEQQNSPLYPTAVFEANTIEGRLLVRNHDLGAASEALLASITVSGGNPMSWYRLTFGPKLELAQDLLDAGQHDVVVQFLSTIRTFQNVPQLDMAKLDLWIAAIRGGGTPSMRKTW